MRRLSLLPLLAACSGSSSSAPDASIQVLADNGVALCGKPVVYLNFEGVTISKGEVDDSRSNVSQATELPESGLQIPAYTDLAERDRLFRLVDDKLAVQSIPVVHTRPSSGDYFMLVFVEDFYPGVQGGRSTTNCAHANPNTIGFVNTNFFSIHGGLEYALHGAMLMLGRAVGLDPVGRTEAPQNCMVNDDFLAVCTFSEVATTLGPCSTTAQDQLALLAALACK
jgi:hypothetical protein